jgi:uncharacterized protein
MRKCIFYWVLILPIFSLAQNGRQFVEENYSKLERMIPMRDGVKLFTSIYVPRLTGKKFPILMERTPYSCAPYGEDNFASRLGPNPELMRELYIFVYQDVRGRYKSEGKFEEMTPAIENKREGQTDESSDTYDTIEWLLHNISNNSGLVGIYGISYPGFYATASLPNAHPAIKAVSPQAPVTDEFIGDDAYHNGAFFLQDNFDFTNYFEGERINEGSEYRNIFTQNYTNAYQYFLNLGSIKNTNRQDLFNHKSKIWDEYLQHNIYDSYWKARNIRPHLTHILPAVLVVGGWFDAEDMYGALHTYEAIERQNQTNENRLIMGPWTHGAWAQPQWAGFGPYVFGENVNKYFEKAETDFFNFYLKGIGEFKLAEATVFETGSNQWKTYSMWPPKEVRPTKFYLGPDRKISTEMPSLSAGFDEYTSDPASPVPYTNGNFKNRNNLYMVEDQRFAAVRPDVLSYVSDSLSNPLTVTGRIKVNLFLSTSGSDLDIIVKIIDIVPVSEAGKNSISAGKLPAGNERLVRAEVFRGKFRKSYEHPEAFKAGEQTSLSFELNEIAHQFLPGHRVMVQIQSSWFPLVDRNPQTFTDIPKAEEKDFRKSTVRIYHNAAAASFVELPVGP